MRDKGDGGAHAAVALVCRCQTEVECVREMARCLRELGEGGVPK